MISRLAKPYSNPYLAGVGLGLVLLAAFVVMGRGLGASGAFASSAAGVVSSVAPSHARANPYFARYLGGGGPWLDWLLIEIVGVAIGGFLSALVAGRLRVDIERGPRFSNRARLTTAFVAGGVMGLGAVLARGCTSGQALTGGALLSVGSWLFIVGAFAAAYAVAPLVRRAWI
ncbi:MAG TPA: YeeE/YedE thiosulfate transporter family protein [Gemmatimonadaceae bacterium]